MNGARAQHGSVLLDNGKVLLVGGVQITFRANTMEAYGCPADCSLYHPGSATLSISVTPSSRSLYSGETFSLSTTINGVLWPTPVIPIWTVTETGGGIVSPKADQCNADFTAGNPGVVHVVVTCANDPAAFGMSTVTILNRSAIQVNVAPGTATLTAGGTQTFQATVQGAVNPQVVWSVQEANGGAISSSGVYTAPSRPGTYHVSATSVDNSAAVGTAEVTVQ